MTTEHDNCGSLERLVDTADATADASAVQARAVQLIQSTDPLRLSNGRKQRLLLSLGQGWVRRRAVWLRPVVVGVFLAGTGAIAGAAIAKWPTALARFQGLAPRAPNVAPRPRPPAARVAAATPPAFESIQPAPVSAPAVVRQLPTPVRSRKPVVGTVADDPILLIQATHALRVDRNPVLARALAAGYLQRHPSGTLADEAFAISIEAAIDHHDPDVAALSAKYLTMFPRGSFRGLAERSLKLPAR